MDLKTNDRFPRNILNVGKESWYIYWKLDINFIMNK
jgi:hypothetical protein